MNKILKTLSFGLIMSSVVVAQENSTSDVFKSNNSLPPTWEGPFKANNSLPPTLDGPFKANNTLPPSWEICSNTTAQKVTSQNKSLAVYYFQMQRQHTRV